MTNPINHWHQFQYKVLQPTLNRYEALLSKYQEENMTAEEHKEFERLDRIVSRSNNLTLLVEELIEMRAQMEIFLHRTEKIMDATEKVADMPQESSLKVPSSKRV